MDKLKDIDYPQVGRHVLFALVVGVACGLASVLLCICVGWSYEAFTNFKWLIWFLPVIGIIEIIAYKLMKLAPNMTTHQVIKKIRANERVSYLLAPGILLTTCMSILCGGSVGKEAGALQMGASLGSLISKPLGIKPIEKGKRDERLNNYPAACGMAACVAALVILGVAFRLCSLVFKPLLAVGNISLLSSINKLLGALLGIAEAGLLAYAAYRALAYFGIYVV